MIPQLPGKCKSNLWNWCKQFVSSSVLRTYTELPPSAVPHISQPLVPKSQWLTAEGELPRRGKRGHPGVSPRGEKPCPVSNAVRFVATGSGFCQRLLPRGRSCQKSALRNRFLTDVGDRRRRQRYACAVSGNITAKRNAVNISSCFTYPQRQQLCASWSHAYGCRGPALSCGCAGTWGCIRAARRRPGTPGSAPGRKLWE